MVLSEKKQLLSERLLSKEHLDTVYLRQAQAGGWKEYRFKEVLSSARKVAAMLHHMGLSRGDRVSIFSKNCAEWLIADFGITLAGMVNVPLFPNQNKETLKYILDHAEVKLVFIGKLDAHLRTREHIPSTLKTINLGYHLDLKTDYRWDEVQEMPLWTDIVHPLPEDTYTIIYSSGTTGDPKGVVFTHAAVANYLEILAGDLMRLVPMGVRHHIVSYLPLAHVYERTSVELASLVLDCDVSFVESLEKFAKNLQEIQPTLFTAVPRIWGAFKQRIESQIAKKKIGFALRLPLISRFIKAKIKRQMGLARCYLCVSGAAHLPESVIQFFKKMGITIQEGSGQTEDFGYTTLSQRHDIKPGFVGTARFGVSLKCSEGELLVSSPCLMKEYYRDKTLTDAVLTEDGWLKTGDLVEMDARSRVKILGRISENFKNQKGEFVAPALIEDQFSTNELIDQCCLVGKMLPSNVLLINLATSVKETPHSLLKEKLRTLQHSVNKRLESHEKISHILVVKEAWTIANFCLTPTLKIRRRVIEGMYQNFIQSSISEPIGVIWE